MKANLKRAVENIHKTNVYTPIIEATVNAIEAIEDSGRTDGKIFIEVQRDNTQTQLDLGDELLPVRTVSIADNGIGFTDSNFESFNTLYSEKKASRGGKGFGRMTFLKYFEKVQVESIFQADSFTKRTFTLDLDSEEGVCDVMDEQLSSNPGTTGTTVTLEGIRSARGQKIDKKLDTIARKIVEKLLAYFALENYAFPEITIRDSDSGETIILNNYIGEGRPIQIIANSDFELVSSDAQTTKSFKIKVFKIFYGTSVSTINLVANNRVVTEEQLYTYIPEFRDEFFDVLKDETGAEQQKNFTIKAYITGDYLGENVSVERHDFNFEVETDMFHAFSRSDIERKSSDIVKGLFGAEVKTRQEKRMLAVQSYVAERAPWLRSYVDEADLSALPLNPDDETINMTLHKVRFRKEQVVEKKVNLIESGMDGLADEARTIVNDITQMSKDDLAHYVVLRKKILNFFRDSLKWDDARQFEKESVIHNIVFPMKSTSDQISYDKHNLWILDERLNFHEHLSSDLPIETGGPRPDILIYNFPISTREGEEPSNPIVVFEFKRPQRNEYPEDENPIKQVTNYVEELRSNKVKNINGRPIVVNSNTPAYGYVVCDLTPKIRAFCRDSSLTESPDGLGYFGFHFGYRIYFEVISFDKLVKDAEKRNSVFFRKLGIDK